MVYNTIHSSLVIWEGRVWWLEVWREGGRREIERNWMRMFNMKYWINRLYSFRLYIIFLHVHDISSCTLYFFMYMIFLHVHNIFSCTWYSFMYIFLHVHNIFSCTWYSFMYTIFFHVHDISSCTWYSFMYMIFLHLHHDILPCS